MSSSSPRSPLGDLTYDVVAVLQTKAKALQAYEGYMRDAEGDDELYEIFAQIRRQDEEHVRVLKEALARRLDEELGYDEEDFDEDYDEDDEEEVEATGESSVDGVPGGDEPGGDEPPRRGESTQRRQ